MAGHRLGLDPLDRHEWQELLELVGSYELRELLEVIDWREVARCIGRSPFPGDIGIALRQAIEQADETLARRRRRSIEQNRIARREEIAHVGG
jgi:hypothetical protein